MYTTAINEKTSIETSTLLTCIQQSASIWEISNGFKNRIEKKKKKTKKKVILVSLVEPGLD